MKHGTVAVVETDNKVSQDDMLILDESLKPFIQDIFGTNSLRRRDIYAAFYRNYRALVISELAKKNKLTTNFEDLEASIWVGFSSSHLIEKFFEQAAESYPETLSTEEACKFLGIYKPEAKSPCRTWLTAMWNYFKGDPIVKDGSPTSLQRRGHWMPTPVSGTLYSTTAVFRTDDVLELASTEAFRKQTIGTFLPMATKKHFIRYLKRSTINRFANFCRTEERRHKERVWDHFVDQRPKVDDPTSWEDRMGTESDQEEYAEMSLLIRRLEKTPARVLVHKIIEVMIDSEKDLRSVIAGLEELSAEDKRTTIREIDRKRIPMAVL